jgi:hypothetical protein
MKFLRYLVLVIANLFMFCVGMILAPVLPLFALGKPHLPSCLSWFDTPDNTLDGDSGFQLEHALYLGSGVTGIKQYINRVMWLWRNPSYGFDISVLGVTVTLMPVVESGDPLISDQPNATVGRTTGLSGSVYITYGSQYFEYYKIYQYGSSNKCLRLRLGWKLSGYINEPVANPLGTKTQFVFAPKLYAAFSN